MHNTNQIIMSEDLPSTRALTIFWFRRDLRLNDNHGFYQALKCPNPVLPVFIFDKNILDRLMDKKDKRINFIHQALKQLNESLEETGSSLFVLHDRPLDVFEKICNKFIIKEVYTNEDYEPYAIERDVAVRNLLKQKGIPFYSYKDQVIFEKSDVLKSDGTPYTVFTPYSIFWKLKYDLESPDSFPSTRYLSNLARPMKFDLPSLNEIGFEVTDLRLPMLQIGEEMIRQYHETRNLPGIAGTSHASVHLRFGTVSVRHLAKLARTVNDHWLNELIWREFFMMILFHFPYVEHTSFKKKYELIEWRNNEWEFGLWCKGETGYPIVDAGMRQLNETGWMHNRVRMIVASFLTKQLLIDWRWGEAYFAEKLLDYELSSNNGNWQWAAGCGCDAAPYFRIFNPSVQQKKFDPELLYIRKWINDFNLGYLPKVVDHEDACRRALETFTKSLDIARTGKLKI
jgi:deoxyribodipyrimidine photo-lyase